MYWPLGAPKVYALSKQSASETIDHHHHDGTGEDSRSTTTACKGGGGNIDLQGNSDKNGVDGLDNINHDGASHGTETADELLAIKPSRGGGIFVTITKTTLTVWQTSPTVALTAVVRSAQSINSYGSNEDLLLRPDALVIVVQTNLGYLIHYSLVTDSSARVFHVTVSSSSRSSRKESTNGYDNFRKPSNRDVSGIPGDANGIREISLRFRMVMRVDAGISKALALDDELVVATLQPAAMQCIRWSPDSNGGSQTLTQLLVRTPWITDESPIIDMVHDRPMNLTCWVTANGKVYAVQRQSSSGDSSKGLFQGFCFRDAGLDGDPAVKVAINARFSLIAVGCVSGQVDVYVVKDYTGNVPLSHSVSAPLPNDSSGRMTCLIYSPDGYCLFTGYERGWTMCSVYGKPGASSFAVDRGARSCSNDQWLLGTRDAFWANGGCELAMIGMPDSSISFVDIARNAATGCLSAANTAHGVLQSSSSVIMYKGHDILDVTAIPPDTSLWQTVQVPYSYLNNQWPIKVTVVSKDGRYIAVAGRRGLAHYSTASGRWKTFDDPQAEAEFGVRGGMCWHHQYLIASVETDNKFQVRVYSREKALDYSHLVHVENLSAPAILTSTSGTDSLLVYTYDNTLLHYIVVPTNSSIKLVQVGQIGFHGIIRAPPRIRAISWILPEEQLEHGDPSQDVATASVLFLVDGKLVLLQPSTNEQGDLKYDMRVIAQNVEYYILLREQPTMLASTPRSPTMIPHLDVLSQAHLGHSLRDSLWFFNGDEFHLWSDIQDVIASAPAELARDLPLTVRIPLDFYPVSAMIAKGIVHGLEADLVQRRDVDFSFFRQTTRTQLFVPQILRQHLADYNSPAALHLATSYQHLLYFAHALEVLLHDVLDGEVDNPPSPPETALLPTAISFLSSFPPFLDIVVNCTRKTELRSWRTLFAHLPPVQHLFELSLEQGKLQTAAGYLLVMHAFEHDEFRANEYGRLLQRAASVQEWDLTRELARFLLGIDSTGRILRMALVEAGLYATPDGDAEIRSANGLGPRALIPEELRQTSNEIEAARTVRSSAQQTPKEAHPTQDLRAEKVGVDYFSFPRPARSSEA
nr:rab6a-gef complex partner protein 1 [Quercus suber]